MVVPLFFAAWFLVTMVEAGQLAIEDQADGIQRRIGWGRFRPGGQPAAFASDLALRLLSHATRTDPPYPYSIRSSSTSNTSVLWGGIAPTRLRP